MSHKDQTLEDMLREAAEEKDITSKENQGHTAQDLRTQVLIHAVPMIEKLQQSIYNKDEDISAEQARSYEMLWPVIQGIIAKTDDIRVIDAKNATEIIKLVSDGKLSISDAASFMAILKDQVAIDELPNLIAKLSQIDE